jgi:hypothetical protein
MVYGDNSDFMIDLTMRPDFYDTSFSFFTYFSFSTTRASLLTVARVYELDLFD